MPNAEPSDQAVYSLLPMKARDFLILFALVDGERHGYRVLQEVEQESDGKVKLDPANLYRSLSRLMERGLLVESEHRPAPELDKARRRYYSLTLLGRRVVEAEAARLAKLADAARAKKLIPRPRRSR